MHVSGHARAEELRTLLSLIRPKAMMPIHGEFRMQAAHAKLAQEAGVPASSIVIAENGDVVELSSSGVRIADHIEAGVTFVDGMGVGDISDVALRDRRHMSEDGVLIVVTTLADDGASAPELITRGFADDDELLSELRAGGERHRPRAARRRHPRDQADPGAHPRRPRPARLRPHPPPPDDPARGGRGMSTITQPEWAAVISEHAVEDQTARKLIAQLLALEIASLAFCRLLEKWARGDAEPEHAGPPPGRASPCRRPRRDGARRARAAARPLPDRAGGRLGRGTLVVR